MPDCFPKDRFFPSYSYSLANYFHLNMRKSNISSIPPPLTPPHPHFLRHFPHSGSMPRCTKESEAMRPWDLPASTSTTIGSASGPGSDTPRASQAWTIHSASDGLDFDEDSIQKQEGWFTE